MSPSSPKSVEEQLDIMLQYLEQGLAVLSLVKSYGLSQTSGEERVELVNFTIANEKNDQSAMEK